MRGPKGGATNGPRDAKIEDVGGSLPLGTITPPSKVPFLRCLEPLHYFGENRKGPGTPGMPGSGFWGRDEGDRGASLPTCNVELFIAVPPLLVSLALISEFQNTVDCKSL